MCGRARIRAVLATGGGQGALFVNGVVTHSSPRCAPAPCSLVAFSNRYMLW
jgi:UDP-N-acetylglucosamine:LPS N-acetylglucosamine transferase